MGDKPPSKTTHSFLRRSQSNVMSKIFTNKPPSNPPKTSKLVNQNPKMIPTQQPSTINNTNLINDNLIQKTFAETTANQIFPKKKSSYYF